MKNLSGAAYAASKYNEYVVREETTLLEFLMKELHGISRNKAKDILAYELTGLVHGEEEAKKAREGAQALFSAGGAATANMPTYEITEDDLRDGSIDILGLLVKAELASNRSEARRNVQQGGVSLDGEKVTDIKTSYTLQDLGPEGRVLKRGKKKFAKVLGK